MSAGSRGPLAGRRVLVTRATEQASELVAHLEAVGAVVVHAPAISFVAPPDGSSLDRVLLSPDDWDWIVFTSVNGVSFFGRRAEELAIEPAAAVRAKVAAVGAATAAALRRIGIEPDAVPERFLGSEIAALLPDSQRGVRTAVVRALEGRDELIEMLRARGGSVHVAVAYETKGLEELPDDVRAELVEGRIDVLTFTSPSTVNNVLRHLSAEEMERVRAASRFVSIGPTTTAALHARSVEIVFEAEESTVPGLVEAAIRSVS